MGSLVCCMIRREMRGGKGDKGDTSEGERWEET